MLLVCSYARTSSRRQPLTFAYDQQMFGWVLKRLARGGLMKGKTIGIDSTTLEANAAMRSIVRRDTHQGYSEYLQRLAQAEGAEAVDAAPLRRMDRKRPKRMRNEEWVNPADAGAEISRLKDGRTALAYKAEQAVDMETGAIVAVTTHGGAVGDTDSIWPDCIKQKSCSPGYASLGQRGLARRTQARACPEA